MSRTAERLIDLVVLWTLLGFAYAMRAIQPLATGVVLSAAVQFWLVKNASPPHQPDPSTVAAARLAEAAATALIAAAESASPKEPEP